MITNFGFAQLPPLVLDNYPGAAFAVSTRKLSKTYSGAALRVRRSSDNAEQDIGFTVDGDFDSSAFSSFVGGGTGYIVTWYDQSGNENDATQSSMSLQYEIYLNEIDTKPAIGNTTLSAAANKCLLLDSEVIVGSGHHSAFVVGRNAQSPASGAWGGMVLGHTTTTASWFWLQMNKGAGTSQAYNFYMATNNFYTSIADNIRSVLWTTSWDDTTWKFYEDSSTVNTATPASLPYKVDVLLNGYGATSFGVKGVAIGEVILYDNTMDDTEIANIQNDIINYFNL